MSLLIKGMNMPKSCADCFFCQAAPNSLNVYFCYADKNKRYAGHDKRPSFCPLVEIPTPHGRLIDADKLLHAFSPETLSKDDILTMATNPKTLMATLEITRVIKQAIKEAPTITEAEE